jgi:hypothetical protein
VPQQWNERRWNRTTARATHICSFFWSGVSVYEIEREICIAAKERCAFQNIVIGEALFLQSEDVADIVFQAIDDSIHHALLMRLGFVFEFAYKKLQDRQKPENWCRSICSLNVTLQRAAMLMAV